MKNEDSDIWSGLKTVTVFDSGDKNVAGQELVTNQEALNFSATSLFAESLIEQLCRLISKDKKHSKKLYLKVCDHLHKMKLIGSSYRCEEYETIRNLYKTEFYHLICVAHTAKIKVKRRGNSTPDPSDAIFLKSPRLSLDLNFISNVLGCSRYVNEFVELRFLAKGGFGEVYEVKHKLDENVYAIKKILLRYRDIRDFFKSLDEVKMLASLNHPNIVAYKAAWLEPDDYRKRKSTVIIEESFRNGSTRNSFGNKQSFGSETTKESKLSRSCKYSALNQPSLASPNYSCNKSSYVTNLNYMEHSCTREIKGSTVSNLKSEYEETLKIKDSNSLVNQAQAILGIDISRRLNKSSEQEKDDSFIEFEELNSEETQESTFSNESNNQIQHFRNRLGRRSTLNNLNKSCEQESEDSFIEFTKPISEEAYDVTLSSESVSPINHSHTGLGSRNSSKSLNKYSDQDSEDSFIEFIKPISEAYDGTISSESISPINHSQTRLGSSNSSKSLNKSSEQDNDNSDEIEKSKSQETVESKQSSKPYSFSNAVVARSEVSKSLNSNIAVYNYRELRNLRALKNFQRSVKEECATLYIQMQLCDENLRDWLLRRNSYSPLKIDIKQCLSVFTKLLKGIAYIHNKNIVHHDIKTSNVFVSNDLQQVQVGDFGLACRILTHNNSSLREFLKHVGQIGTELYAAPEQINSDICSPKSDIYSVGIILFELIQPFTTDMERIKVISKFKLGEVPEELAVKWPDLIKILTDTVSSNLDLRPTATELLNKVNHYIEMCSNHDKDAIIIHLKEQIKLKDHMISEYERNKEETEKQLKELKRRLSELNSTFNSKGS